ncbi:MAG: CDP-glycerol glycerophosphotransferase family protein [Blastocatellia bacterium]
MNVLGLARIADKRLQRWRYPDARRVLVNARRPMNYAIVAPVVEAMKSDPRISFCFVSTEDPHRAAEIYRDGGPGIEIISPLKAASMRFDAYLVADLIWFQMPRGACRIFMFHGVAGKYSHVYDSPRRSMREWNRLFFINQKRLRNYISANAIDVDSTAPRLVGMPKVDCLVDGTYNRKQVLESLGLDPSRPAVLYAPTWSANSSLNIMGEEIVERLGSAGYTVIVKLHDGSLMTGHFFSGGVDWRARLQPLLAKTGGRLATGSDSSPLLAAVDVLVTDHSSIGFEYLLLNRPLIRIHVGDLIANADINPDYVEIMSQAAMTIVEASQIVAAVERSLADPMSKAGERKAAAAELFYRPGSATGRAVREMYEAVELDPPQ